MTTSWTDEAKLQKSYILKEDSFYLLLESGDKIVISYGTDYTNTSKSSDSWTNSSKSSDSWTNTSKV